MALKITNTIFLERLRNLNKDELNKEINNTMFFKF